MAGDGITRALADERKHLGRRRADIGRHALKVEVFWADGVRRQYTFLCGDDGLIQFKGFCSASIRLADEIILKFWIHHDGSDDHFELLRTPKCLHLPQTHAGDKSTILGTNSAKSAHIKTRSEE